MKRLFSSMIVNQASINQSEPSNEQKPNKMQRRTLIRAALGGALAAVLSSPDRLIAQGSSAPNNPFALLLKGVYRPVVKVPDLGLTVVHVDSTFSFTDIHPVTTVPGSRSEGKAVAGNFYVQLPPLTPNLVAYDLPGGAIAMQFTPGAGGFTAEIPDGQGGVFLEGTFELTIPEATGIYSSFVGGHNHMVDRLHFLANGQFDENCYCIISLPSSLQLWWS